MKTFKTMQPDFRIKMFSLSFLIAIVMFSCKSDKNKKNSLDQITLETPKETADVIDITTRSMEFKTADTISSGWNTFRYKNRSNEPHFFVMEKYPKGKTIENTKKEIGPIFDNGMDLINEGKPKEGLAEFNKLPKWFFEVVFSGGSGLIAPKHTSETTIKLEPGYYIMECYVKMPNGKFHSTMGMLKQIIVTEEKSGNAPPEEAIAVNISSTEGIDYEGIISRGEQIFSVEFIDQVVHENFVGHDVNLVKLDDNASLEALENWMDWTDPKGLITPVPEGVTFLGGVNDSPAGSVGYFKATLEPGKYAVIAEVPNALKKGMLKTFLVSE